MVTKTIPSKPKAKKKDKDLEAKLAAEQDTLSPWLVDCTNQNEFMISSDKILTILDPKPTLLEKYQKLIK